LVAHWNACVCWIRGKKNKKKTKTHRTREIEIYII
jgi:hypothetical protein